MTEGPRLRRAGAQRADRVRLLVHEALQADEERLDGPEGEVVIIITRTSHYESFTMSGTGSNEEERLDGPGGVPGLGVVVGHRHAEPRAGLEAARRREHLNRGRTHGKVVRKLEQAVVAPAHVGLGGAGEHEVPLQD